MNQAGGGRAVRRRASSRRAIVMGVLQKYGHIYTCEPVFA